jgi:hypothetical protein
MKKVSTRHTLVSLGLTLAFSVACSDNAKLAEPKPDELTAPLTVPVPALEQFVVLSRNNSTFGQRTIVSGGDIGVAAGVASEHTLTGGIDSRLGVGEVLLAPRVVLGDRVMTGEIGATIISAPPSAVTGPRSAYLVPPAAPTPSLANPGASDVVVNTGQTSTLASGRYRDVTVNGTLNLTGGLYELRRLVLNPDARLIAQAESAVRVQQTLSVADRGHINMSALLVAERTVRGADRAILAGSIAARQVILGNDARLAHQGGFECATAAGCDDGDPCTDDLCVDAKCAHGPAPNGTACSDGATSRASATARRVRAPLPKSRTARRVATVACARRPTRARPAVVTERRWSARRSTSVTIPVCATRTPGSARIRPSPTALRVATTISAPRSTLARPAPAAAGRRWCARLKISAMTRAPATRPPAFARIR